MTASTLRPYQTTALERVEQEVANGTRAVLIVAPTGAGKTVMGAAVIDRHLIERHLAGGGNVVFLVHRRELTKQAVQKLYDLSLDPGIIQAGFQTRPDAKIQVASVQTLHRRAISSSKMDLPRATMVMVDEAHHITAQSWQDIIRAYPGAILIGLTATPCRADGRGLGNDFKVMVEVETIPGLIKQGFLVGTLVYAPHTPDLKGVHIRGGDYKEDELAERVDKPQLVGDILTHWLKHGRGRKTVVFCVNVQHSMHVCEEFRRAGVVAEHIDGSTSTEERDSILAAFRAGRVDVICNCNVLTEGFDCPDISCLILARPTKSMLLYRQMVGRGLRPADGKDHCLVLDHAGVTLHHGFVDDEIEWTLSPHHRAQNKQQAARSAGQMPALRVCPECKAIRQASRPCEACGWMPKPKARAVDVADGELGLLNRDKRTTANYDTAAARENFRGQLAWIAQHSGYKPGWVSFKFKERFGYWPPKADAQPIAPTPEVKSWVRSRQIAWAKSKAREGNVAA